MGLGPWGPLWAHGAAAGMPKAVYACTLVVDPRCVVALCEVLGERRQIYGHSPTAAGPFIE